MSVSNVKVAYIRPLGYNNLEEWMNDTKHNAYVGRGGVVFIDNVRFPKQHSIFANPFKIGKDLTREAVINKYETYIRNKIETDRSIRDALLTLKGKNLGCWCAPEPCHADVLLKLIDEYSN